MKKVLIPLIIINITLAVIVIRWFIFETKAVFLDVGQGDAELLMTRAGNILIDGGPDGKVVDAVSNALPFYDKTIDLLILSHPNADHLNGFLNILQSYNVRRFIHTNTDFHLTNYEKLKNTIRAKHIPEILGTTGMRIKSDDVGLRTLWPDKNFLARHFTNTNLNDSVITLLANIGNTKILYTGDIDSELDAMLIPRLETVDILKVPHHGSKFSSSGAFLEKLKPQYAIIEVGKNNYGHPTQEALTRLQNIGSKILRTDINGTIICGFHRNNISCPTK